jgi:hypothetical protein
MTWTPNRLRRRATTRKPIKRPKFFPRLVSLESRDTPTAFTPGNIVIVREADNTLNSTLGFPNGGNAPVFLDEYTPSGTLVQSVALPYSAGVGLVDNQAFTFDPSNGTGCGQANLSFDSSSLLLAGNDVSPGTTDAVAKAADRVIAQVGIDPAAAGGINTLTHGLFGNTDDARAVMEADPTHIYVANHANGSNLFGGNRYINGLSSTPNNGVQTSTNTNTRGLTVGFDGRLYWTTGTGGSGIYTQASALPTTSQADVLVRSNSLNTSEKIDGVFLADMNGNGIIDAGDRFYYTGSQGTGLDVSVFDGTNWGTPISLGNPAGSNVIGLAAQVVSPTHVVCYISVYGGGTTTSSILRYDDIGPTPTAGAGFTTVASLTAPTGGSGYRGVSFVPVTPTVIGLTSSTAAATPGGSVTFTATLSNAGAGLAGRTVNFIDNNNTVLATATVQTNGTATFTTTALPLGENDVKVYFAGVYSPDIAQGVSNTVAVQVTGTNVSTVALTSSPNPSTANQAVTFTATVTGGVGSATGTVTFTADSTNVLGTATIDGTGHATLTISSLAVGSHTVTAHFSGDANYLPSDGALSGPQVVHAGATVSVTSSAATATAGTAVTLTATVNGNGIDAAPTGSVTFYSDGVMIGGGPVTLTGNQAQLPNTTLSAGSHMITAVYSGDTTYASVTSGQFLQNEKQAFAQGDLLVTRLGDGTRFLDSSAAQVFIDEYTPAGALVQSVAMPNVDGGPNHILTLSGSSPNSGTLAVSADGHYVTFVGIDAAPGTPVVTSQSPATTPRVVARLDSDSVLDTSTTVTIPSGEGFGTVVGAASNDGKEFWIGGDGSSVDAGLQYAALGGSGTPTPVGPTDAGARSPVIYGGQLYASTGNNASPIVRVGTGLPTSQTTFTGLPGITVVSNGIQDPHQFLFFRHDGAAGAPDLLYVADLQTGLLKFYFDGTNWVYSGDKLDFAGGLTGLTGYRDASGNIVLFGTGSKTARGAVATNLITFTDTTASDPVNWGANFPTGNVTELVPSVASKGEAFRGIAFVPTPAPVTVANVQVGDGTAQRSEVRSLTVTFSGPVTFAGGNAAAAFQLQHVQTTNNVVLSAATALNAAGQTVVTLTFSGSETDPVSATGGAAASLADGRYQLTVLAADVSGSGGALAGNGTTAGTNYVTPAETSYSPTALHLYRQFGDADGTGINDLSDLTAFRNTYNAATGNPSFVSYLDADNSGVVDLNDLTEFRNRYNHSVYT